MTHSAAAPRSEPIVLETVGSAGVVTLNRPRVHNAVDEAMMTAWETILDRLERDDAHGTRVLILTGAGERSFCAGGDLAYFSTLDDRDAGRAMARRMRRILDRLAAGPRPVIAAVGGDALGGGCEILTACHLRLAVRSARFAFRQAAMGVVTGWGGTPRLYRLVGRGRALRLLLTAETVDAREALGLGLVDVVVEERDRLLETALALAERIAAHAPEAIAGFLELDRALARGDDEAAAELETERFAELFQGAAFRRRLARWTAREKTEATGR